MVINPLIEAKNRLAQRRKAKLVEPGHRGREARRKVQTELTKHKAVQCLEQHLPRLFHPQPDTAGFDLKWPWVLDSLEQQCGTAHQVDLALRYLVHLLHLGNRQGIWQLPIPCVGVRLSRTQLRHNEEWFRLARACSERHAQWLIQQDQLLASKGPEQAKQDMAAILQSSCMHSGINTPGRLLALAQCLLQPRPLHDNGLHIWLELKVDDEHHPTNCLDQNVRCSVYRFFPALPTLGLIYRWLRRGHNLSPITNMQNLLELVGSYLIHGPINSLPRLCSSSTLVAEMQSGVEWPLALVEAATGHQWSASLPTRDWLDLCHPQIFPLDVQTVAELIQSTPRLQTGQAYRYRPRANPFSTVLGRLRLAVAEKRSTNHKKTAHATRQDLERLLAENISFPERMLVAWLLHHLVKGGNKPSTLATYLSRVGTRWLNICYGEDIHDWDGDDFFACYQELLQQWDLSTSSEKAIGRKYLCERLTDLHEFGVREFALAPLPESLFDGKPSRPHIRAGFISEPLFVATLNAIAQFPDLPDTLKETLRCLLIVGFRAGLRRGELIKLRLKDIEVSPEMWLFVRNTSLDDGKTASATRNIPLGILLTDQERSLIQGYLGIRRGKQTSKHALAFPDPSDELLPLDGGWISSLVGQLLRRLSGRDHYVFHHLRHSALSRLQLVMHHDCLLSQPWAGWQHLLPWDAQQCAKIRETIAGPLQRSIYWALAQFAGHLAPETTLNSYLHFSDLVTAACLQQANYEWTSKQACYFTGLSLKHLPESRQGVLQVNHWQGLTLLRNKLVRFTRLHLAVSHPLTPIVVLAPPKPDYYACLELLDCLQQGRDYRPLLWQYQLDSKMVKSWFERAVALRSLPTRRGQSRHIRPERARRLIPGQPRSHAENAEMDSFVKTGRQLYRQKQVEFATWLRYLLTHTDTQNSAIRFSAPEDLQAFIVIATELLPGPRWRLELFNGAKPADLKPWQHLAKGMNITHESTTGKPRKQQLYARLYLTHPNEQDLLVKFDGKAKKYSSPTLKLFAYIIAILMFSKEEIEKWSG